VVNRRSKILSVMVLTEDSGSGAYTTIRALAKEMLKLLVPSTQTDRVGFIPLEDANAQRVMHGAIWKSTAAVDEHDLRLLRRTIVTELLKPDGFVMYHIDGDRVWADHSSSENDRKFRERMRAPIEAALRQELTKRQVPETLHSERMKRLCLVMPFYSIEAWLYQNTREALRLCVEEGCKQCRPKLEKWLLSRASLDEVHQPKEELCLRDKYNAHLASTSFPADEVYEADASFTHAVDGLLDCDDLTTALKRTSSSSTP
jgi:hypothetical protein